MKTVSTAIQVIDRAIQIIDIISEHDQLTRSDIAQKTGINATTVYRICSSLCSHGYLEKNADSSYSIGWKMLSVAGSKIDNLDLVTMAIPILKKYSQKLMLPLQLVVLKEGQGCATVSAVDEGQKMELSRFGKELPDYATATGKLLLAQLSTEELDRRFSKRTFQKFCDHTITSLPDLKRELRKIREQGYSVARLEYLPDHICLATPVYNYRDEMVCALCVQTSVSSDLFDSMLDELVSLAQQAAKELSVKMGLNP